MSMNTTILKRIVSALLIAPVFLYVLIAGGYALTLWLIVAFFISLFEWYGLAKKRPLFLLVMACGFVYMALSYSSFFALREAYSVNALLLFLGMIWFSDIGAYFVGKTCGGPKLIQHISPNKTWSGFGGALFFPALFGIVWSFSVDLEILFSADFSWYSKGIIVALLGVSMGIIGQAGDLLISSVKRQAGVKDTGTLIPGHGGLLDRIDSMLLGAPVFLILITLLSDAF